MRFEVEVLEYPISDRYCSVGATATIDMLHKKIRIGGVWFDFDERWLVKLRGPKSITDLTS